MELKNGDRINCIRDRGLEKYLTLGRVYKVWESSGKMVSVKTDTGYVESVYKDRFVLARPNIKWG